MCLAVHFSFNTIWGRFVPGFLSSPTRRRRYEEGGWAGDPVVLVRLRRDLRPVRPGSRDFAYDFQAGTRHEETPQPTLTFRDETIVAPLSGCWNHGSQPRVFAPLDPGLLGFDPAGIANAPEQDRPGHVHEFLDFARESQALRAPRHA